MYQTYEPISAQWKMLQEFIYELLEFSFLDISKNCQKVQIKIGSNFPAWKSRSLKRGHLLNYLSSSLTLFHSEKLS